MDRLTARAPGIWMTQDDHPELRTDGATSCEDLTSVPAGARSLTAYNNRVII
jgi:hypothetical protein